MGSGRDPDFLCGAVAIIMNIIVIIMIIIITIITLTIVIANITIFHYYCHVCFKLLLE